MGQAPNRRRRFILGAIGGGAGVIAMELYWKAATSLAGGNPRERTDAPETDALDSISLVGTHYEAGEFSTAAMGRLAYRALTGRAPQSEETRTALSYLVHWAISATTGGAYGALRHTGRGAGPRWRGGGSSGMRCSSRCWGLRADRRRTPWRCTRTVSARTWRMGSRRRRRRGGWTGSRERGDAQCAVPVRGHEARRGRRGRSGSRSPTRSGCTSGVRGHRPASA